MKITRPLRLDAQAEATRQGRKLRSTLAPWLLVATFSGCFTGLVLSVVHNSASLHFLWPILGIIAFFLACLFPVFVWLAIALVLFSPVFLYLLLSWLFRRYKRKKAERAADQQLEELYQQLPATAAPPREQPIPLLQRRFRH